MKEKRWRFMIHGDGRTKDIEDAYGAMHERVGAITCRIIRLSRCALLIYIIYARYMFVVACTQGQTISQNVVCFQNDRKIIFHKIGLLSIVEKF